jgi:hypothetical protein
MLKLTIGELKLVCVAKAYISPNSFFCLIPDDLRTCQRDYILHINPLSRNAPSVPYFFFFTSLTLDDFTYQWGTSAA